MPRIAWKTGTSAGRRDAWTVAWNPAYVVGVWIGNPDGRPCEELVGGSAAAPLAWDLFRALYPDGEGPWFDRPRRVAPRALCAVSGQPCGPHCPERAEDLAIDGITATAPCTVHRVDAAGRVTEEWPPAVAAWLRGTRPAETPTATARNLAIVSPAPGTVLRIDPLRPAASQTLHLRAEGPAATSLYWFVDDAFLAAAPPGEAVAWPLTPGPHRIACADPAGRRSLCRITVER